MAHYFTIRVNNYDQFGVEPFTTFAGALLCVSTWASDGRINGGDRVEIIEHAAIAHDISNLYKTLGGGSDGRQ